MYNYREICKTNLDNIDNFWNSINLYIKRPHTVNKRLAGAVIFAVYKCTPNVAESNIGTLQKSIQSIENITTESIIQAFHNVNITITEEPDFKDLTNLNHQHFSDTALVIVNKLLAKNLKINNSCYEVVILNFIENSATFISFDRDTNCLPSQLPYFIRFDDNNTFIWSMCDRKFNSKHQDWLKNTFFPKFIKWCEQTDKSNKNVMSLALIDIEEYNILYNQLKEKYGVEMVKIWPERTDPSKFVFEDVAIASYLLLLWRQERKKLQITELQSFVDLGCGNGLLVYILSSEGHRGFGIDVRKRGIWDFYPKTTILKTEAIIPSNKSLFPDTDWIIGNHSDELSPWIPVIAARSSHQTRFFSLPCCAFEFDGSKYQRKTCKKSQYNDFLNYIEEISTVCGFETVVDRLKIPSTKRICIIGNKRIWGIEEMDKQCKLIQEFIDKQCKSTRNNDNESWNSNFKPRSNVEKVQNCTQIDKSIEQEIVKIVFDYLIAKKKILDDLVNWNIGGIIALPDVAKFIPNEKLQKLKSECGGLQTLLKNNHQIFLVQQGTVQIRRPIKYGDRKIEDIKGKPKAFVYKQKSCWFLNNHPDGCPFNSNDCSFKH